LIRETIQRVATNTIYYTRKQANKEWSDKECALWNEEKTAARERTIQIKTKSKPGEDALIDFKVFAKINPHANTTVQHYQAGF
jgi:hypothetical protein